MKKSIIFGVASIALFTLIGAGCVQDTSTPVTTESTDTAVTEDQADTVQDVVVDKTYTNETWGYSFTIPEDRWVDKKTGGDDVVYVREYLADGSKRSGSEIGFTDFSVSGYESAAVATELGGIDEGTGCVVNVDGNDGAVIQFMAHECILSETMDATAESFELIQ